MNKNELYKQLVFEYDRKKIASEKQKELDKKGGILFASPKDLEIEIEYVDACETVDKLITKYCELTGENPGEVFDRIEQENYNERK